MNYFSTHPGLVRGFIAALVALLVGITVFTFFNFASSPTDENIFADPKSYLLVNRSFFAVQSHSDIQKGKLGPLRDSAEEIRRGDLLEAINGRFIRSLSDYQKNIGWINDSADIALFIHRPKTNERLTFVTVRNAVPESLIVQLPYHFVNVTAITPGGASDRAGMMLGDLIYRINGKTFANAAEADRALRRGKTGNAITYDVYRNGEPIALSVTLARFGIPIPMLTFFIVGLFYMAFGAFIAYKRPEIFGALLLGLAFILLGYFISIISTRRDVDVTFYSMARDIIVDLSIFFGIAVLAHSVSYYPKERPEFLSHKAFPWVTYSCAAICSVLVIWINGPMVLLAGISIPLYRIILGWKYRKQLTAESRKIMRIIKWTSIGVALFAGAIAVIAYVSTKQQLVTLIGIPLILIPLAHLYVIARYRLLGIDLRVRRNVRYTLATVAWSLVVVAAVSWCFTTLPAIESPLKNLVFTGATIELNDAPELQENRLVLQKILLMVVAVGITAAALRLRRAGQGLIDRRYYRSRYDYRRSASELTAVMTSKIEMVDLARGIVRKLAELMHLKRTGVLFFRNEKICCCQESYGVEGEKWEGECVDVDEQMISAMKEYSGVFRAEDLPYTVRGRFRVCGYHYIVPIRSKEKLIGALLIGEKLAETTLRQDDLEFLSTAATQASVAIENAFLYEELEGKTRLQHELDIARNIQLASLPQKTPAIEGLDIAGISVPAMEVGGDFFDYLDGVTEKPDTLTVVVGDVSGKGTSAALYMSRVQGILRSLHEFAPTPADLFVKANRLLCRDLEKHSFVTAFGALFKPRERSVLLARAGHLPLFLFHADTGTIEKMVPGGIGLGLDSSDVFLKEMKEESVSYRPGDIFLFVTDGVVEANNGSRQEFGEERLLGVFRSNTAASAEEIRDKVLDEVRLFTEESYQYDDQTIVVVKVL